MWTELGDGVFSRRYAYLDFNVGLVLGSEGALVVDTRASRVQAAEVLADVRAVTPLPVRWAVDTHWHWDHSFGNSEFVDAAIWAHVECSRVLAEQGEEVKQDVAAREPAMADELLAVEIRLPDRVFDDHAGIDVGGRLVTLRHHGPGHTEGDIVVDVPDAAVCFAGDLIEQGAPPSFGDSYPVAWPDTLHRALDASPASTFVPGHGDHMSRADVAGQVGELRAVASLAIESHRAGMLLDAVDLSRSPYPAEVTTEAMERAHLELGAG